MREETATARAPCAAACAAIASGTASEPSSTLATNSTGLAVSEPRSRAALGASSGTGHRARRAAGLQRLDHRAQPRLLRDRHAVAAARLPGDALDAALGLLEVGEHELRLDRLDVAQRIDAALGVDDALVAVGAHDVHDRVGLADVREEAVAETLALVRAGHEAGDVVEVDRVPDDLRGADGLRDLLQALVADGHDGDVRLDRRERVVGRLGAGFRQRVEERGLARVGHADDADPRAHRASPAPGSPRRAEAARAAGESANAVPSSAPASTSEG